MDERELEQLVRQLLLERLGAPVHGVRRAVLPQVTEADRLDTGRNGDRAYTRDLFTLEESPRLGAGVMEVADSDFPWHLEYDELDYVISGRLDIHVGGETVSAGPGEVILIPAGSDIRFAARGRARFLYVTYPADWNQPKH